ncbi:hypothetical protein [Bdellovibrio sp. ZAP7]|uniref:hypothetical protein n=1 Tax=Bdellovibrio sp. ZAP7 TaxID=2231053 RepID=UPI001FEF8D9C|nr:hypothetical protein [Bdellovibrio sp. ZAP7]
MKILNKEISASNFQTINLVNKIKELKFEHKLLLGGFIVSGAITFLNSKPTTPAPAATETAPESLDTFIPQGLTLIPLEIANSEALSSIVGHMGGVVDLYLAPTDARKGGIRVASRVKLVRAPRNPDQFAILVKETEGQRILQQSGPFIAVVQNPEVRGGKLTTAEKQKTVRIEYSN